MHRIAAAMLIAAAVLALNAGLLREAFAADSRTPTGSIEIVQPVQIRSTKLLSLLLVLEALRQAPVRVDGQKV